MDNPTHFAYRTTILSTIADFTGTSIYDIGMQDTLVGDLFLDSLDCIELTMEIEDKFNIEISDDEAETVHTVQNLVDLVFKTIQKKVNSDQST